MSILSTSKIWHLIKIKMWINKLMSDPIYIFFTKNNARKDLINWHINVAVNLINWWHVCRVDERWTPIELTIDKYCKTRAYFFQWKAGLIPVASSFSKFVETFSQFSLPLMITGKMRKWSLEKHVYLNHFTILLSFWRGFRI